MGWIKDRLWRLGDAFEEFPRVLWLSIFYFVIAMVVMLGFSQFYIQLQLLI